MRDVVTVPWLISARAIDGGGRLVCHDIGVRVSTLTDPDERCATGADTRTETVRGRR